MSNLWQSKVFTAGFCKKNVGALADAFYVTARWLPVNNKNKQKYYISHRLTDLLSNLLICGKAKSSQQDSVKKNMDALADAFYATARWIPVSNKNK